MITHESQNFDQAVGAVEQQIYSALTISPTELNAALPGMWTSFRRDRVRAEAMRGGNLDEVTDPLADARPLDDALTQIARAVGFKHPEHALPNLIVARVEAMVAALNAAVRAGVER